MRLGLKGRTPFCLAVSPAKQKMLSLRPRRPCGGNSILDKYDPERINQLLKFPFCAMKSGSGDLDFQSRPDKEPWPEGIRIILSSGNKVPVSRARTRP
jgi:hypothetical protein